MTVWVQAPHASILNGVCEVWTSHCCPVPNTVAVIFSQGTATFPSFFKSDISKQNSNTISMLKVYGINGFRFIVTVTYRTWILDDVLLYELVNTISSLLQFRKHLSHKNCFWRQNLWFRLWIITVCFLPFPVFLMVAKCSNTAGRLCMNKAHRTKQHLIVINMLHFLYYLQ